MSSARRLLPHFLLWATLAGCNISDPAADGPFTGGENNDGACTDEEEGCDPSCADPTSYFEDRDEDGFGNASVSQARCDGPPDGFVADARDCDDDAADAYPGAVELCNGADDDCDDEVDEGCDAYTDDDGDGYCATLPEMGPAPTQCSEEGVDCDDASAEIFPGAAERCGVLDGDCDGEAPRARLSTPSFLRGPHSSNYNLEVSARRVDDFAVAWMEEREENNEIRVAVFDAAGVLETAPLTISDPRHLALSPQLVYDPGTDRFVVAFVADDPELGRGVYVARITASGLLDGEVSRVADMDGHDVKAAAIGDGLVGLVFDTADDQGEPQADYARVDVATLTAQTVRTIASGIRVGSTSLAYSAAPSSRGGTLGLVRSGYRNGRVPAEFYTFVSFHADDGSVRQSLTELDVSPQGTFTPHLLSIDDAFFLTYRTSVGGSNSMHIAPVNPATGQLTAPGTALVDDLKWRTSPVAFGRESAGVFVVVYPSDAGVLRAARLDRSAGWSTLNTVTFGEPDLDGTSISPLYSIDQQLYLVDRKGDVGLFKWIRIHSVLGGGEVREPITPTAQASALQSSWHDVRRIGDRVEFLQNDDGDLEVYEVEADGSLAAPPAARARTFASCLVYRFHADTISCVTVEQSSAPCDDSRRHTVVRHEWDPGIDGWSSTMLGELPDARLANGSCKPPLTLLSSEEIGDATFLPYQSAVDGASEYRVRNRLAVFGPAGQGLLGDHVTGSADDNFPHISTRVAAGEASMGYVTAREDALAGEARFDFGVVGIDGVEIRPATEFASFSGWDLATYPSLSGVAYADGHYVVIISQPSAVAAPGHSEIFVFDASSGAQVGEALEVSSTLSQASAAGVDGMLVVSGIAGSRPVLLTIDPTVPALIAESGADYTTRNVGQSFLTIDEHGALWFFRDSSGRVASFAAGCAAPASDEAL